MKLIYRGTTYDYDPTQAKTDRNTQRIQQEPYNLTYRGSTYRVDPRIPKPISDQSLSYELIYRGCTYQVTRNAAGKTIAMNASTMLFKQQALENKAVTPKVADKQRA
jgi:hypothetical protein